MWYIYSLTDPRDGRVRYVGKANNVKTRLCLHIHSALHSKEHNHRMNWIRSLLRVGQTPSLSILESGEGDWQVVERKWIKNFRDAGYDLVNATDGGEGALGCCHSEESKAKHSIAARIAWQDPEVQAKQRAALKARWQDPAARAKQSAAVKAARQDPALRARHSDILKARWQNPGFRNKMDAFLKSPERLAKRNDAIKATLQSPEARAKMRAVCKVAWQDPDRRARQSAHMKAYWATRKARSQQCG